MSKEKDTELQPNTEHLAKLLEGVDVWNAWSKEQRKDNVQFAPQLQGANLINTHLESADLRYANLNSVDLSYAHLEKANLSLAHLEKANLSLAHLEGAVLSSARLTGAKLIGTYLDGAVLTVTHFEGAILNGAHLAGAQLHFAHLEGADLSNSDLQNAQLFNAHLQGANLKQAYLENTNLREAHLNSANLESTWLQGADFQDADLTNTNLAYAKDIRFSDNKIKDAVITSTTKAPWLTLKKNYTNTMLLFHIVGVIAFFLPYLVNVAVWRSLNLMQELNLVETFSEQINVTKCFAEDCTPWPIWQLLIGLRRSWYFAALTLFLIPYNGLRIYLTQQVSILKDSEQATGITPTWQRDLPLLENDDETHNLFIRIINYRHGYRFLYRIHQILQVILWIAIASASIHAFSWLTDIVELPTK